MSKAVNNKRRENKLNKSLGGLVSMARDSSGAASLATRSCGGAQALLSGQKISAPKTPSFAVARHDAHKGTQGRTKKHGLLRRAVLNTNNLFFVLFALVTMLPAITSKDPQRIYSLTPAFVIWAIALFAHIFANKKKTRATVNDVASIILALLAAWTLATATTNILPEKMFPAPGIVFAQIIADGPKILAGIGSSLGIIAEGFVLGGISALVLGLVLGINARSNAAAEKVVSFLSAIPPIVYIPYGIALLPSFHACSVMVIFLATFWPTLTGALAGVASVDERIINSARVLNVSKPTLLFRIVLPSALPLIFNGLNIALCLSFILLTSAEMIGGSSGMGYYVKYYSDFGDYTRILSGIIVIGVVITVISSLFAKIQKHCLRWK